MTKLVKQPQHLENMSTSNKTVIQYILIKTEKNKKKIKHAPIIDIFWMDKKIIYQVKS